MVFEGGEGAGKSTQVGRLAEALRGRPRGGGDPRAGGDRGGGADPQAGAGPRGRQEALAPGREALLYAADRAHHVATVVRPALARGAVVISDRYVDSSLAYQGAGRTLPVEEVSWLSSWATGGLKPDLVVLLDIDPGRAWAGSAARGSEADLLESESVDFHERVRYAFLDLASADPGRYLVLDAPGRSTRSRRRWPRGSPACSPAPSHRTTRPDDGRGRPPSASSPVTRPERVVDADRTAARDRPRTRTEPGTDGGAVAPTPWTDGRGSMADVFAELAVPASSRAGPPSPPPAAVRERADAVGDRCERGRRRRAAGGPGADVRAPEVGGRWRTTGCGERHDPRLDLHRAAGVGAGGRGPGLRGGAAVSARHRLRGVRRLPHHPRRHPRRRTVRGARRAVDRRLRDAGAGARRREHPERWPVAGTGDRGRGPAHRGGRQRAAQGDRGAAAAYRLPAVHPLDAPGRHLGDHPVTMPGGAVGATVAEAVAAVLRDRDGVAPDVAAWAAAAPRGTSSGPACWPGIRRPAGGGRRCWRCRAG